MLGATEAGLFPGVLFYLSLWFPAVRRGRVTALLIVAGSTSPLVGAPLSTWLMELTDGHAGLHGWQLMFIIEAIPAILLGIWCFLRLPEKPGAVAWLSNDESRWLQGRLDQETAEILEASSGANRLRSAFSPIVTGLGLIYLGFVFGEYAIGFFLPSILELLNVDYNLGLGVTQIGLLGAIPYLIAAVAIIGWGLLSDRRNERVWHTVVLPAFVGAAAIIWAVFSGNMVSAIIAFSLTTAGVLAVAGEIRDRCRRCGGHRSDQCHGQLRGLPWPVDHGCAEGCHPYVRIWPVGAGSVPRSVRRRHAPHWAQPQATGPSARTGSGRVPLITTRSAGSSVVEKS
ncbi:MFS transporter [Paenarthrobacter nitroguajacolicus]|uniref:MFS transporter n=1 Tax=Paenarthrobacter nitroguajacolicus TaxID=211146 RepID=UPI00285DC7CE|nr:MFS transporter [Paenarthrobacter nitroguajacolicus]MDR6639437.1 MFS family permease [Paenarthrobacter nitroguajacolicus]